MVKKTHIQGGLIISLLTAPILIRTTLNIQEMVEGVFVLASYVGGACAGSLLPDIDMKSSYISKKVPLFYRIYGKRFKHRGFTHSILALVIMCIWCMITSLICDNDVVSALLSGAFMGCVSHILLDLFTIEGVNLLSPIGWSIYVAKIKTGSRREKKLNKFLEVIICILLGFNTYMMAHNIGKNIVEVVNDTSIQLRHR